MCPVRRSASWSSTTRTASTSATRSAKGVEAGGGTVIYGKAGQEFPSTETSFGTIVSNVLATQPDVIAIIAFDQTKQILPALASAKFAGSKLYFVDGNLSDYTPVAGVADLTGAKGTQQGVDADKTFKDELDAWYTANDGKGKGLGGIFNYGPESYDAVVTLALAADLAKKNDSASIEPFILPVTGYHRWQGLQELRRVPGSDQGRHEGHLVPGSLVDRPAERQAQPVDGIRRHLRGCRQEHRRQVPHRCEGDHRRVVCEHQAGAGRGSGRHPPLHHRKGVHAPPPPTRTSPGGSAGHRCCRGVRCSRGDAGRGGRADHQRNQLRRQ